MPKVGTANLNSMSINPIGCSVGVVSNGNLALQNGTVFGAI